MMIKKKYFLLIFAFVAIVHLAAQFTSNTVIEYLTKPFLIPLLSLWLLSGTKKLNPLIPGALLFSWFGDILLIFQNQSIFFTLGLGAFLIAHVFYIIIFKKDTAPAKENIVFGSVSAIAILIYIMLFIGEIDESLGEMKIPVYAYATVISVMLWFAINRRGKTNPKSYRFVSIGALLFVISDSLIAWNKFAGHTDHAGIYIMMTYLGAQVLIVSGILNHSFKSS